MKYKFAAIALLFLIGCAGSPPPITVLQITTTSLPSADVKQIYAQQIAVTGGVAPYTFSVTQGSLPSGITLSPQGVLSGVPTVPGDFSFTVRVVDSNKQSVQIHVQGKLNEDS